MAILRREAFPLPDPIIPHAAGNGNLFDKGIKAEKRIDS
jgi:hypothetical protein